MKRLNPLLCFGIGSFAILLLGIFLVQKNLVMRRGPTYESSEATNEVGSGEAGYKRMPDSSPRRDTGSSKTLKNIDTARLRKVLDSLHIGAAFSGPTPTLVCVLPTGNEQGPLLLVLIGAFSLLTAFISGVREIAKYKREMLKNIKAPF